MRKVKRKVKRKLKRKLTLKRKLETVMDEQLQDVTEGISHERRCLKEIGKPTGGRNKR